MKIVESINLETAMAVETDGKVVTSRADKVESDPMHGKFLKFIARDIETNPQRLQGISPDLVRKVQSLVAKIELALDAPLGDEDE
jgi:antitoxin PrlF